MKRLRREDTGDFELNLTPMMDLFCALVPFLLMTAAFVRLGAVDVTMPAQAAKVQMEKSEAQKLSLMVEVKDSEVQVSGFKDGFRVPVSKVNRKFPVTDLEGLTAYLQSIETEYTDFGNALFYATGETAYENAIFVLDAMKTVPKVTGQVVLAAGVVQ